MKLIVGLGNPGKGYENTRHNCGFRVIDLLEKELNIEVNKEGFKGLYGKGKYHGQDIILLKPQTYMNISGEAVRQTMDFFKIPRDNLLVIYDDLDMATGKLRLRIKGGAGGHNGVKSIISHIGSQDFKRIRIGINKDPLIPVPDYVLGKFTPWEIPLIEAGFKEATACVREYLDSNDFNQVMNKYN